MKARSFRLHAHWAVLFTDWDAWRAYGFRLRERDECPLSHGPRAHERLVVSGGASQKDASRWQRVQSHLRVRVLLHPLSQEVAADVRGTQGQTKAAKERRVWHGH